MRRLRGFTLVELLVVIGIIAVLISILIPALTGARTQALIIKCSANEHMLGLAIMNYAAENSDQLPLNADWGYPAYRNADYDGVPDGMNQCFFQGGGPKGESAFGPHCDAQGNFADAGANIGALVLYGYLGSSPQLKDVSAGTFPLTDYIASGVINGRANTGSPIGNSAYYVPQRLLQTDQTFIPARFCPGDLANPNIVGTALLFESSYVLNPHWAQTSKPAAITPDKFGNAATNTVVGPYRTLTKYPAWAAMLCENLYDKIVTGHHQLKGGIYAFPLMYRDGHVDQVKDTLVMSQIAGRSAVNSVSVFEDYLDMLETENEGLDPLKNEADPIFNAEVPKQTAVGQKREYYNGTPARPTVPW